MTDQVRENIARDTKSEDRVTGFKKGTPEWQAEYDMLLPDGATCNDCRSVRRCCSIFGQTPYVNEGKCQFHPSRFLPKQVIPDTLEKMTQLCNRDLDKMLSERSGWTKISREHRRCVADPDNPGGLIADPASVDYKGIPPGIIDCSSSTLPHFSTGFDEIRILLLELEPPVFKEYLEAIAGIAYEEILDSPSFASFKKMIYAASAHTPMATGYVLLAMGLLLPPRRHAEALLFAYQEASEAKAASNEA